MGNLVIKAGDESAAIVIDQKNYAILTDFRQFCQAKLPPTGHCAWHGERVG